MTPDALDPRRLDPDRSSSTPSTLDALDPVARLDALRRVDADALTPRAGRALDQLTSCARRALDADALDALDALPRLDPMRPRRTPRRLDARPERYAR